MSCADCGLLDLTDRCPKRRDNESDEDFIERRGLIRGSCINHMPVDKFIEHVLDKHQDEIIDVFEEAKIMTRCE